jgi:uncharacterized alpha-E superfamily protein
MLSRVAETMFWMARYMERTSGVLQLLRTNYISSQDEVSEFSWRPLLNIYSSLTPKELERIEHFSPLVFEDLVINRDNPSSVFNNITNSRENARSIQDHITKEVWQCLNDYYHFIRDPQIDRQMKFGDPVTAFDTLIKHNFLFNGTVDNTMTRGEGLNYLNIGRFLERAIQTTDIIRIKLGEMDEEIKNAEEIPEWRFLLYAVYGYEQYLKTYRGNIQPHFVLEMILQNASFPHSILYSLDQVYKYFARLKNESLPESYIEVEYLIGKTVNKIKYKEIAVTNKQNLNSLLLEIRSELLEIATSFSYNYFGKS